MISNDDTLGAGELYAELKSLKLKVWIGQISAVSCIALLLISRLTTATVNRQSPTKVSFDRISTHQIDLLDDRGVMVAQLASSAEGPFLILLDKKKRARLYMGVDDGTGAMLVMSPADLRDQQRTVAIMTADERAGLTGQPNQIQPTAPADHGSHRLFQTHRATGHRRCLPRRFERLFTLLRAGRAAANPASRVSGVRG
jgi:hypothetical protein